MDAREKIELMAATLKPIKILLEKKRDLRIDALKAYEPSAISNISEDVQRMRETEAQMLRHEIGIYRDLLDTINAMYPDA
jgi:hypothetical protein